MSELDELEAKIKTLKREHEEGSVEPGTKLDDDKPHCWQVLSLFSRALLRVSEHGTKGNRKYSSGGWLKVPDAETRYKDAMLRHQLAMASGEVLDEDGHDHLTAIAWNAIAILELRERNIESGRV